MNHRNLTKSYPQNLRLERKKKKVVIGTRARFTKEAEVAMLLHSAMAAGTSSYIASTNFPSILYLKTGVGRGGERDFRKRKAFSVSAQQVEAQEVEIRKQQQQEEEQQEMMKQPRPVEPQRNVQNKNLSREYGGQWLSCATRHVRIYAAYIDPETCAFDQTQIDKLTLILDPTDEFVWTDATCTQIYSYFQGLVDHYEGAPLTEYTLRLIGSDIEHYIRRMLYKGEIQYNMNARVLNFSMGKPRIGFNYRDGQIPDVNL